ncbi:hypothetical protein [Microbacterium sp. T32]|uniref:hypothetical protein n=1 Tax=Microbacterium sp. T32 TaxID=1776083 RepID=UPI0007AB7F97|nr:hypothetical protein [Microbacterium sp. T32]KZE41386.1 hypothetical protein AVW09_02020 [Microbacterium sp. T32]
MTAWEKYREHAAATAYRRPGSDEPFYMRTHTPASSGEWAARMRKVEPGRAVKISEPTDSNPMQSAPFVLFAAYDTRNKYGRAARPEITATHPYALTTYVEGDLSTEFYATADDRDRALYLLERAA